MRRVTVFLVGWVLCGACGARRFCHWPSMADCDALECPSCGESVAALNGPAQVVSVNDPGYVDWRVDDWLSMAQRRRVCS